MYEPSNASFLNILLQYLLNSLLKLINFVKSNYHYSSTLILVMAGLITSLTASTIAPSLVLIHTAQAFVCRDLIDAPIAASDNSMYVTWASNKTGNWEVFFRASHDAGKTFGDKINLSNSPKDNSFHSDVATSGNSTVYVSFHDNRTGNVDTYVVTSSDGGKTFGKPIRINGTGNEPQQTRIVPRQGVDVFEDSEENTRIEASGHSVYVVSWDKKSGNWEVFFARSIDNGQTFEKTINLSNSSNARSDRAWLVVEGNNVYVSWWETARNGTQMPVFIASNDNGATFGPVLKLAADGPIGRGVENTSEGATIRSSTTNTTTATNNNHQ